MGTKFEVVLYSEDDLDHAVQKSVVDKVYTFADQETLKVTALRVTTQ